jgi:NADH-quinone oxidoreductase subunit M
MSSLDLLFLLSGTTLVTALLIGRLRVAGIILVLLYGLQLWALSGIDALFGEPVFSSCRIKILSDQTMSWRYNAVSWFFAMLAIGAALFSAMYASGDWIKKHQAAGCSSWSFHTALAAGVLSMVLLLGAGDFLALFLGLELVGWSGFLLMAVPGGVAARAALRYLVYAFSGAMAILFAMALIYAQAGSLEYGRVINAMPSMNDKQLWALLLLMGGGFAVKMGLLPFHLWQAQAYAEAPAPGAVFLGAVFARMGFYDFIAVFVSMVGIARLTQLEMPYTEINSQEFLTWLAAFTIILPSYIALKQLDIRYLLTWVGVGQGGFMLLGLIRGDAAGTAGSLSHIFNFGMSQTALLMAAFAIVHRTGRPELSRLEGIASRMPLTFAVLLIGALSLAGLPPMAGFFSKWLIYSSLLSEGVSLLFVATAFGSLGTVLALYRLVKSLLRGRSHGLEAAREAPASMLLPMLILAGISMLVGFLPGPLLTWVARVQAHLDFPLVSPNPGGIAVLDGGSNTLWLLGVLISSLIVAATVFFGLRSHFRHLEQDGEVGRDAKADRGAVQGLIRLIAPLYCAPFARIESVIVWVIRRLARGASWLYGYEQPSLFLLIAAVVVALWAI